MAGVSVDYLVRLEQSRARNPSTEVLASLSRALQLSSQERDHLFRLARKVPPGSRQMPTQLTPGLARLVTRLEDAAVAVFDPSWSLIAWNPLWAALMGDPSAVTGRDRNIVWRHFTGAAGRVLRSEEEAAEFGRFMVADLHMAAGRYPDDPDLHRLIGDLHRSSAGFRELWGPRHVAAHRSDRKTIDHPEVGPITLDCDVLSTGDGDLRIVVYTADPAGDDADKLRLVQVIGLQTLAIELSTTHDR